MPRELEVDLNELHAALSLLQSFDPPGIGARDMADSLWLQLRQPDALAWPEAANAVILGCARQICTQHLLLLTAANLARLREALGYDEATLRLAHKLILRLEPHSDRAWTVPAADYAIPDVLVSKVRQTWRVELNRAAQPRLHINGLYAQILNNQQASLHTGLQSQLQQARWLIRNVEQRYDTILRVSQAIVDRPDGIFRTRVCSDAALDVEGCRRRVRYA